MTRLSSLLSLALLPLLACGSTSQPADPSGQPDAPPSSDPDSAPPTTRDPAGDGDFVVTETTVSIPGSTGGRTVPATLYTPTTGTNRPLVIVSPGYQLARTQYASYAHHLATWGFVVALTDYADSGFFPDHAALAADVTAVITDLLARPALALDPDHVATVGHSLGGKISTLAASGDPRIDAVVGWDPVDSSSPSVAPQLMGALHAVVAVIGETTNATGGTGGMSCAPAAENYAQFYAAAKSPAVAITVAGADHMDWVDDPSCGFCTLCTAGTAAPELVRAATRRLTVAWLRLQLLADASMMPWVMQPPEAGLTVQAR